MNDIFREVDEDYRQEQLLRLWHENARWIIGALVAAIVAATAYSLWQNHRLHVEEDQTYLLAQAIATGETASAEQTRAELEKVIAQTTGHRRIAAELAAARAAQEANDREGAIRFYGAVSGDSSANQAEKGLAELSAIALQLDDSDPAQLSARLKPLAADDSPWRFTAREWQALLAMRQGDNAGAHEILAALTKDPAVPQGIRTRAGELAKQASGS